MKMPIRLVRTSVLRTDGSPARGYRGVYRATATRVEIHPLVIPVLCSILVGIGILGWLS